MVDALDSKSSDFGRGGSIPFLGTYRELRLKNRSSRFYFPLSQRQISDWPKYRIRFFRLLFNAFNLLESDFLPLVRFSHVNM